MSDQIPAPTGFVELIGLDIQEIGPDRVLAMLDVDERHHQPYGVVHGGIYCSIIETIASYGAVSWAAEQGIIGAVGVSNATDFLRSHRTGTAAGSGHPHPSGAHPAAMAGDGRPRRGRGARGPRTGSVAEHHRHGCARRLEGLSVLLADLVAASNEVAETAARSAKVRLLAAALGGCRPRRGRPRSRVSHRPAASGLGGGGVGLAAGRRGPCRRPDAHRGRSGRHARLAGYRIGARVRAPPRQRSWVT